MYSRIRNLIDTAMGRLTMYKGVLSALLFLDVVAIILSYAGKTGVDGTALLATTLTLSLACYLANWLLAWLYRAQTDSESWLITALILACIIAPSAAPGRLLLAALCGVVAMASKYVIVWRGSHVFNPAAFGAAAMSLAGLLPATWWIACPAMLPFTIIAVAPVLYRHRKFLMFTVFALVAVAVMLFVQSNLQSTPVAEVLRSALVSWPIIFLGGIMLTEPLTMPQRRHTQLLEAVVVATVFASQLELGPVSASPHLALLIGNVFVAAVSPNFGAMLHVRSKRQLAPDVTELSFDRPKGLRYEPGQYMDFTLAHPAADFRGNRRTFSLVSAPQEDELRITFRTFEKGSSFKRALSKLEPGDRLRATGLHGEFILPADPAQSLLLIAGGIGITPFRSMLVALANSGQKRDIVLLYTASDEAHLLYRDDIALAANAGVEAHFQTKRLSAEDIRRLVPDAAKRTAYISGADGMVHAYVDHLRAIGVRPIRTDQFTGY